MQRLTQDTNGKECKAARIYRTYIYIPQCTNKHAQTTLVTQTPSANFGPLLYVSLQYLHSAKYTNEPLTMVVIWNAFPTSLQSSPVPPQVASRLRRGQTQRTSGAQMTTSPLASRLRIRNRHGYRDKSKLYHRQQILENVLAQNTRQEFGLLGKMTRQASRANCRSRHSCRTSASGGRELRHETSGKLPHRIQNQTPPTDSSTKTPRPHAIGRRHDAAGSMAGST